MDCLHRIHGKGKTLAFKYPETTLAEACQKRLEAKKLLNEGIDPSAEKKERALAQAQRAANTFEKVAREWHTRLLDTWQPSTARDTLRRLEIDIFPEIGSMPVDAITHQHMIRVRPEQDVTAVVQSPRVRILVASIETVVPVIR